MKKEITDYGVKAVRDHVQYQIDLGLWPYPCEMGEGEKGILKFKVISSES